MNICPDCSGQLEAVDGFDDCLFKCLDCGQEYNIDELYHDLDEEVYNNEEDPMNWETS